MTFSQISDHIYLFKDWINVYVIKREKKAILIDFGSGNVFHQLSEIDVCEIF